MQLQCAKAVRGLFAGSAEAHCLRRVCASALPMAALMDGPRLDHHRLYWLIGDFNN